MFQIFATAEQVFTDKQLMRLFLVFMIFALSEAAFATAGVTYHGRLINPAGSPVVANVVRFRVQIRTPGPENCLLFEEEQVQDLSLTNGVFALDIGSTPTYRKDTTGLSFDRIFSNQGSFNVPGNCVFGNSYTPSYADNRKMEVFFNDGNFVGWEPLPTQTINYVPKAVDALQVGGFNATNLLRVENAGVPQSVGSMTSADFTEMMKLILGTSTQYTKAGQLNGSALPSLSTGQSLGWNGSAWTAVTPLTSSSLPNCNPGEVLKSNAGVLSCVNDATGGVPSDATTSSKGIVQISATGGIDVNAGVISLSDAGTAGTYYKVTTDAKGRVTSGAASLVEADIPNLTTAGKVSGSAINAGTIGGSASVNTSGNITTSGSVTGTTSVATQNLRIYESTNTYRVNFSAHPSMTGNYGFVLPAALPLTSGQVLSSDTSGNLSWSTPSAGSVTSVSGSAPISVTGTSTPTVSIAQANTTTSGYLSATDWNTFNNKLGTSSSFSGDVTGTSSATVIANNAVNSAKIADGSVGVADLDFAGAMATNTGVVVRNGTQFYNKTCAGNQALIWTVANGWSCSAVVLTESDPKVGTNTTNYLSKWDGSALVTSGVYESGGNIGIGTASPAYLLDLNKGTTSSAFHVGSSNADNGAYLTSHIASGAILSGGAAYNGTNWIAKSTESSAISMGGGTVSFLADASLTAGNSFAPSVRMVIGQQGNVGIGTSSPSEKLEVVGNIKATQLCIGADCRNAWPSGGGGSGTVTSVGSGTGLTGGPITGTGTLNVDVGTTTGKIVQVAAGNKLPAIDGSDLTNLNASNLSAGTLPTGRLPALTGDVTSTAGSNSVTLNTVPISKGGTGQTTATAALNALLPSQGSNSGKVLQTDGTNATWVSPTTGTITALTGDVTASGTGSVAATIANDAVNSAKIADGAVGVADLNFAGTMATNTGIVVRDGTQLYNKTCTANQVLIWTVANGWSCSAAVLSESDPKVGSNTTNYLSKWNGSALVTSGVYEASGSVGVGTSSPSQLLHLSGGTTYRGLTSSILSVNSVPGLVLETASTGEATAITGATGSLKFYARNTAGSFVAGDQKMQIDPSGNVGIGTTTPGYPLTVATGSGQFANGLHVLPSTHATSRRASASIDDWAIVQDINGSGTKDFALYQGSAAAHRMYINTTGNVGIGTTAPASKFDVAGSISSTDSGAGVRGIMYANPAGFSAYGSYSNHDTLLVSNNIERLRLTTSGNVGVGTTNPSQKLTVAGTIESTSGGFKFPDGSVQTTASSGGNVQCAGAPGNGNNLIYCVNMTTGRAVYAMAGGSWALWQTANQSAWTSFATGGPYAVSAQVISGVGYVIVTRLSDGTSVYGVGSSTTSWAPWNSGGIWPP